MNIGIVEDHPATRGFLYEIVEFWGHRPFAYQTGWHFFEHLFSEETVSLDVVLVDLVLSEGITGMQVIQTLRTSFPSFSLLVVSAASLQDLHDIEQWYPGVITVQKPFSLHTLRSALKQATSRYSTAEVATNSSI